jgi:protocatechuate 3,4-dioxygenase beta subunit
MTGISTPASAPGPIPTTRGRSIWPGRPSGTCWPTRPTASGQLRPSHIHYKVSADDYGTLTTQFQPKGDPFFDGIAKHSLDVPFVQESGIWKAQIDIVLRSGMALHAPEREPLLPRRSFFFLGAPRRA